jgi:hypothetical protein
MSAELVDVTGRVLTVRISGVLTYDELVASQQAVVANIPASGRVRLLLLIEDFEGTAKRGNWGDLSFQLEWDDAIERIAIVCEPGWREAALCFTGQGIRRMPIEHFHPADLSRAQAWADAD